MNRTVQNYVHHLKKNWSVCKMSYSFLFLGGGTRGIFFLYFFDFSRFCVMSLNCFFSVSLITFLTQENICEAYIRVIMKTTVFGDTVTGLSVALLVLVLTLRRMLWACFLTSDMGETHVPQAVVVSEWQHTLRMFNTQSDPDFLNGVSLSLFS